MTLNRTRYAIAITGLLLAEIAIAAFVHDGFVRPYLGDSIAVILVYCGLRAGTPLHSVPAVALSLLIACAIEFGQKFGLLERLGLGDYPIARVILGTGFDPHDFLAYAGGAVAVIVVEAGLRAGRRNFHR